MTWMPRGSNAGSATSSSPAFREAAMLLSDLIDRPVHAPGGIALGRVVDVRFRRGARQGRREGDLELIALIVSPHSRLSYYGYERGTVNGPAVIARTVEWLHR